MCINPGVSFIGLKCIISILKLQTFNSADIEFLFLSMRDFLQAGWTKV